jgi:hypothetical protein
MSALSTLAEDIYNVLRTRVPARAHQDARITYSELLAQLPSSHGLVDGRDPRLAMALGDLVRFCQSKNWPLISALVVRADTRQPGAGYYDVAPPNGGDVEIEWAKELERVKQQLYPVNRSQP